MTARSTHGFEPATQRGRIDGVDLVTFVGIVALIAASFAFDASIVSILFAGFFLSLATWNVYRGTLLEGAAWLSWMIAMSILATGSATSSIGFVGFITFVVFGLISLFLARSKRESKQRLDDDSPSSERHEP